MIKTIRNIFSIPDLRNRIMFTLGIVAVFRLGGHIPTPGINASLLEQLFEQNAGTVFGFVDIFSGGNFRRLTVFALGIMPYITASIILQLLTPVWPYLDRLNKEGEMGRQKITTYTRYLTVILSAFQSFGIALTLQSSSLNGGTRFVYNPGPLFVFTTVLTLTTGSVFVMWLGEQITQRGIGEGMSLLIFVGIVAGLPRAAIELIDKVFISNQWNAFQGLLLLAMMIAAVGFIVYVERGERRVNVQYATRMMGRKVFGGQTTHLPIRVNAGGVMPVIFASSILAFPQTFALVWRNNPRVNYVFGLLAWGEPLYTLLYVAGIIFFAYFYISIIFNPNDIADNVRRHGGFVPGIRPGKNTAEFLNTILTRLTLVGGCYLAVVSLVPEWMISGIHLQHLAFVGSWIDEHFPRAILDGLGVSFYFGGTSLLIVVGVAMDTVTKVESHLLMRQYEGLTPGMGRMRGRRGY